MFVAAVLFGVDLGRLAHEIASLERMRLGEHGVMGSLGVIAEFVPLGRELVIVGSGPMVFCGLQMGLNSRMSSHESLLYGIEG